MTRDGCRVVASERAVSVSGERCALCACVRWYGCLLAALNGGRRRVGSLGRAQGRGPEPVVGEGGGDRGGRQ